MDSKYDETLNLEKEPVDERIEPYKIVRSFSIMIILFYLIYLFFSFLSEIGISFSNSLPYALGIFACFLMFSSLKNFFKNML